MLLPREARPGYAQPTPSRWNGSEISEREFEDLRARRTHSTSKLELYLQLGMGVKSSDAISAV